MLVFRFSSECHKKFESLFKKNVTALTAVGNKENEDLLQLNYIKLASSALGTFASPVEELIAKI